jgi:hypothetical protein
MFNEDKDESRKEVITYLQDWEKYNLRLGQIFEQTFEKIKADGKKPFEVEDSELLKYIKDAYKGIC